MADFELEIRQMGEREGYRVVDSATGDFRSNPKPKPNQTVRWHSPEKDAYVLFLAESPFDIAEGKPVKGQPVGPLIEIKAGGSSDEYRMKTGLNHKDCYEYAVIVKEDTRKYIYVRGAASPPGVAVGP